MPLDLRQQAGGREGFGHVAVHAGGEARIAVVAHRVSGDRDNRRRRQAERQGQPLTAAQQERKDTILNKLRPIESRINILITRAQPKDEEKQELDTLIENRRKLILELADLAAELSRQEVSDLATIQQTIPSGHALLIWVDVTSTDKEKKVNEHWACILKSSGEPVWVQLPGSGEKGRWTDDERKLTTTLRAQLDLDSKNMT